MANGKRETDEERAARDREERIALLKMKQGIIEESEMIPESGYEKAPAQGAASKLSNFFYRNKAFVFLGVVFVALAAIIIYQFAAREKEDLRVLLVAYDSNSMMMHYSENIAEALEKYCPDFDGNGKVHVTVSFIDRSQRESGSQYDDAQSQRLNMELEHLSAQLIIADEGFVERVNLYENITDDEAMRAFFTEQTDKFGEDELFCGVGIPANKTALPEQSGWTDCPDNVFLFIRSESDYNPKNDEENAVNRERAEIVLQNILDNKIIN